VQLHTDHTVLWSHCQNKTDKNPTTINSVVWRLALGWALFLHCWFLCQPSNRIWKPVPKDDPKCIWWGS